MSAAAFVRSGARTSVGGAMKLARLLEMSEGEFDQRVRHLELDPLFSRLVETRAVRVEPYAARLAARKPDGRALSAASEGLAELLDGQSKTVALIRRIGQERFEEFFLGADCADDQSAARACGLAPEEVRLLRELVDRAYILGETQAAAPAAAPAAAFSTVAGLDAEGGALGITFFKPEAWKGRYRFDGGRLAELRQALPFAQARRLDRLVAQLELLDRRKSTLYRVLEALIELQRDFLLTGEPAKRRPLLQQDLCRRLDAAPSVLSRLLSNKAVRLPWGLEAPIKSLMPGAKQLLIERVGELVASRPELSDDGLRSEVARLHGARLSRRSIAQYRKDLGLAGAYARRAACAGRNTISLSHN